MLPLAVTGEYRWLCAVHKASRTLPHRRWRAGMDLRVSRKLCPCLPVGDSLGHYRDNFVRLSSVPVQRKNPADTCCFDADYDSLLLAVSLLWFLLLIVQSSCFFLLTDCIYCWHYQNVAFELEVVKHRGVCGWDSILYSPESTINSTSRQNMPTIAAHIANNRRPVFLPEYLAKILSLRFAVYLKRQKRKGAASRTGIMTK